MKNVLFIVFLCVLASCADKNEVTLRVKVDKMLYSKVVLLFNGTVKQVELDAKGRGTIKAEVPDYAYACFYYGEDLKNIFLEKGKDLDISFEGKNFNEAIQVEGGNAPVVDFLNTVEYASDGLDHYLVPFNEYVKVIEARTGDALKLLKASGLDTVSSRFVQLEQERIRYMFAMNLFVYPVGYAYMAQDTAYKPGDDYYETLRKYMVEREDLVSIPEYRRFISNAAVALAKREGEKCKGLYDRLLCEVKYIGEHFTNEKVKQSLITIVTLEYITASGEQATEELKALCNQYI